MPHEPKLSVFLIQLKPINSNIEKSNRYLFRNINGDLGNTEIGDNVLFMDFCQKFITVVDTENMYADDISKKCFTANQISIGDNETDSNVHFDMENKIIHGVLEGGKYGKQRKKTSTLDKTKKADVNAADAITDNFYFLLYTPLSSKKSILMLQSYSDDSIDTVMKVFFKRLLSYPDVFKDATISRYTPLSIIQSFQRGAVVSGLVYTTQVPGTSLLDAAITERNQNFKVTIKIEPTNEDIEVINFPQFISSIERSTFKNFSLSSFRKKKGRLKNDVSGKSTPFEIGSDFEINPAIPLTQYLSPQNEVNFNGIHTYAMTILNEIKPIIYASNAVQEP